MCGGERLKIKAVVIRIRLPDALLIATTRLKSGCAATGEVPPIAEHSLSTLFTGRARHSLKPTTMQVRVA